MEEVKTAWVFDRADLINLLENIRSASEVVMDIETTGLDEHAVTGGKSNGGVAARISLASLTLPQANDFGEWNGETPTTYVVPLSHPRSPFLGQWVKVMRAIARTMVKYSSRFVNAHAKFDARWIYATTGVDIVKLIFWDTQSSSHLIDETIPTALKERAARTFGIERWDDHDLSYPGASEQVDIWELGEYAAKDTYWTWRLYEYHRAQLFLKPDAGEPVGSDEIADARLGQVAKYVSMPTARCLGMIEQRGIRLDIAYAKKYRAEQIELAERRLVEICERYDMPRDGASVAATSHWFKELTQRAIEAGELRIASMTRAGNVQWTKHVLGKQAREGSEIAKLILEQRDAKKQAEFLTSWLEKVTPDGTIHSTYRAGHVATGRLSSADPNMQQVARKLRPAFIPREGFYMADFDYSQLELRVAAFISRSEPMMEAYRQGLDLHSLFAADQMTRRARALDPSAPMVKLEDVPEDERQKAKAGNFGLLYGQQAPGFRNYAEAVYGVTMSEEEAQEVYDGFFETWTGMREWQLSTIKQAARRGYITSPIGRRRNLPYIRDANEYMRGEDERKALNSPVQGFGSDLMQMAIASIYGELPGAEPVQGFYPVATVHDSTVGEIEISRWEEIAEEVKERMTNLDRWLSQMGVDLDVPLEADVTVGTRWSWNDIA